MGVVWEVTYRRTARQLVRHFILREATVDEDMLEGDWAASIGQCQQKGAFIWSLIQRLPEMPLPIFTSFSSLSFINHTQAWSVMLILVNTSFDRKVLLVYTFGFHIQRFQTTLTSIQNWDLWVLTYTFNNAFTLYIVFYHSHMHLCVMSGSVSSHGGQNSEHRLHVESRQQGQDTITSF